MGPFFSLAKVVISSDLRPIGVGLRDSAEVYPVIRHGNE